MDKGTSDLCAVTGALYQADLAGLQAIAAEEAKIYDEFAALDAEQRRAAALTEASDMALRQFGGDLLWNAWVGRKRQALNLRLANLRIRKEAALQALQRSFGKKTVADKLLARATARRLGQRKLRELSEEQAQIVLRAQHADNGDGA